MNEKQVQLEHLRDQAWAKARDYRPIIESLKSFEGGHLEGVEARAVKLMALMMDGEFIRRDSENNLLD